jgi:hypothetical protein
MKSEIVSGLSPEWIVQLFVFSNFVLDMKQKMQEEKNSCTSHFEKLFPLEDISMKCSVHWEIVECDLQLFVENFVILVSNVLNSHGLLFSFLQSRKWTSEYWILCVKTINKFKTFYLNFSKRSDVTKCKHFETWNLWNVEKFEHHFFLHTKFGWGEGLKDWSISAHRWKKWIELCHLMKYIIWNPNMEDNCGTS